MAFHFEMIKNRIILSLHIGRYGKNRLLSNLSAFNELLVLDFGALPQFLDNIFQVVNFDKNHGDKIENLKNPSKKDSENGGTSCNF